MMYPGNTTFPPSQGMWAWSAHSETQVCCNQGNFADMYLSASPSEYMGAYMADAHSQAYYNQNAFVGASVPEYSQPPPLHDVQTYLVSPQQQAFCDRFAFAEAPTHTQMYPSHNMGACFAEASTHTQLYPSHDMGACLQDSQTHANYNQGDGRWEWAGASNSFASAPPRPQTQENDYESVGNQKAKKKNRRLSGSAEYLDFVGALRTMKKAEQMAADDDDADEAASCGLFAPEDDPPYLYTPVEQVVDDQSVRKAIGTLRQNERMAQFAGDVDRRRASLGHPPLSSSPWRGPSVHPQQPPLPARSTSDFDTDVRQVVKIVRRAEEMAEEMAKAADDKETGAPPSHIALSPVQLAAPNHTSCPSAPSATQVVAISGRVATAGHAPTFRPTFRPNNSTTERKNDFEKAIKTMRRAEELAKRDDEERQATPCHQRPSDSDMAITTYRSAEKMNKKPHDKETRATRNHQLVSSAPSRAQAGPDHQAQYNDFEKAIKAMRRAEMMAKRAEEEEKQRHARAEEEEKQTHANDTSLPSPPAEDDTQDQDSAENSQFMHPPRPELINECALPKALRDLRRAEQLAKEHGDCSLDPAPQQQSHDLKQAWKPTLRLGSHKPLQKLANKPCALGAEQLAHTEKESDDQDCAETSETHGQLAQQNSQDMSHHAGSPILRDKAFLLHNSGMCKPCLFIRSAQGCSRGNQCAFCHLAHEDRAEGKSARKQAARDRSKQRNHSIKANGGRTGDVQNAAAHSNGKLSF